MRQEIEKMPNLSTENKRDPECKVFLSYNSKDKLQVRQIRDQLGQQGIETWMDEKNIDPFDDWEKKIKENISQMDVVIVFLGSSEFGEWQKWEITQTKEEINRPKQNRLLPLRTGLVILGDCKQTFQEIRDKYYHTPYGWLFNYQTVDLRKSVAPIEELITGITGQQSNSNVNHDSLLSERDVNYTKLQNLLEQGEWEEADLETLTVMLQATGRQRAGWLSNESIENFPCTDLRTIDQLWVKYSKGRFGFSVQKRIWESEGKDYEKYGKRVGWRKEMSNTWLRSNNQFTFSTDAPEGHLPGVWLLESAYFPNYCEYRIRRRSDNHLLSWLTFRRGEKRYLWLEI